MASLVVLYGTPQNAEAFDTYYYGTHIPIAKKIPGLRKYEVSDGTVMTPAGLSKYHLVATLYFDDAVAIQNALVSPEGQAAAADVANFATGTVEMLMFNSNEV
jgi:uncharacterized protein (TIGR02118 family)